MTVAEYTIYVCCFTIVMLLGMMALFLRTRSQGKEYKSVKRHLAASMFFYALVFAQCLFFGVAHNNTFVVNCYVAPFYYYFAYYLFSRAVRKMLHAPQMLVWKRLMLTVPLIVVGMGSYFVYLFSYCHGQNTLENYISYVHSPIAKHLSYAIYTLVLLGHNFLLVSVYIYSQRFKKNIDNYFSESSMVDSVKLRYRWLVVGGFMLLCINSLANLALSAYEFHIVASASQFQYGYMLMAAFATLLLIAYYFIVFNTEYYYDSTSHAFNPTDQDINPVSLLEGMTTSFVEGMLPSRQSEETESKQEMAEAENVKEKLARWSTTRPYPFLTEGLCITDLADAVGVSERLLSEYLNSYLHQSFNNYINGLRIAYVKNELLPNQSLTISDIAYKSGFNDASALIKVFKRYEGMTPGRYREQYVR